MRHLSAVVLIIKLGYIAILVISMYDEPFHFIGCNCLASKICTTHEFIRLLYRYATSSFGIQLKLNLKTSITAFAWVLICWLWRLLLPLVEKDIDFLNLNQFYATPFRSVMSKPFLMSSQIVVLWISFWRLISSCAFSAQWYWYVHARNTSDDILSDTKWLSVSHVCWFRMWNSIHNKF